MIKHLGTVVLVCLLACTSLSSSAQTLDILRQDLEMQVKNYGPDSPQAAKAHYRLADALMDEGAKPDAEIHYRVAQLIFWYQGNDGALLSIRSKLRSSGENLKGETQESVADIERYIGLAETHLSDAPKVQIHTFFQVANSYKILGKKTEAERNYRRAYESARVNLGRENQMTLSLIEPLASSIIGNNNFKGLKEAITLMEESFKLHEKTFGVFDVRTLRSRSYTAALYSVAGEPNKAEILARENLERIERHYGSKHSLMVAARASLSDYLVAQAKFEEAEDLLRQSIELGQRLHGAHDSYTKRNVSRLVEILKYEDRLVEAEIIARRMLSLVEQEKGGNSEEMAYRLGYLAEINLMLNNWDEAQNLALRSLRIYESLDKRDLIKRNLALNLSFLAQLQLKNGGISEAENYLIRAKDLYFEIYGDAAVSNTFSLNWLRLQKLKGNAESAQEAKDRFVASLEIDRSINVASKAKMYHALALESDVAAEALKFSRLSIKFLCDYLLTAGGIRGGAKQHREVFMYHINLLSLAQEEDSEKFSNIEAESFEAMQMATLSGVGDVVAKTATRFASSSGSLSDLVRQRQELGARLSAQDQKQDSLLGFGLSTSQSKDEYFPQRSEIMTSLAKINAQLEQDFPQFFELISMKPVDLDTARKILKDDEALMVYAVGAKASYLCVVRNNKSTFIRLNANLASIESSVQLLRQRLQYNPVESGRFRPYDVDEAVDLYQKIFAPALAHLDGVKHVMLVLDGPLQSLPFSALIRSLPSKQVRSPKEHSHLDWLARHYTFTVVPSVSSLRTQRVFAKSSQGNRAFMGFGDPALNGRASLSRSSRSIDSSQLFKVRGSLADAEAIRQLPSLPETAQELQFIAKSVGGHRRHIYLRQQATEANVKRTDLKSVRILAFSTHAAMSGQVKGHGEPGLIFTPPGRSTELDDGYLSASEVAQLHLNADLVLLSACNTAAPNGVGGSEGLSGLAKSFFYAGARSLLVSHWSVDSQSTRQLIVGMFDQLAKDRRLRKSDALNRSALALMKNTSQPLYGHPYFWAPFIVAGGD